MVFLYFMDDIRVGTSQLTTKKYSDQLAGFDPRAKLVRLAGCKYTNGFGSISELSLSG